MGGVGRGGAGGVGGAGDASEGIASVPGRDAGETGGATFNVGGGGGGGMVPDMHSAEGLRERAVGD